MPLQRGQVGCPVAFRPGSEVRAPQPAQVPVRRLLAPSQGAGCLMLAQQQSFLVEPAAKN